ncbi:uncharacterized protein A1O5_11626 [Cladophialophora psammophila CBS 110553]|uniref:Major facilitator superfamily (MFS) profile domain-containing protein n=1 Tax=Cladophialophora psammophila CBS 110553 TaxID=1182543 RepID=W9WE68_9EURO|nr:uncharacterized protein A1O5_11626 [Cladophialophora psammophila CBS 110553]EXJ63305.1 hypothetical protein A1O5_11626 [Cladophialophora psammophila CBS 110553]
MDTIEKDDLQNTHEHIEAEEFMDKVSPAARGDNLPKNYYRSPQFIGSFLSMAISFQGAFLGYVMAANVITIINEDLGPTPGYIWILLIFVLCQTVTFTLAGRFGDIFGRRWIFIGANALAFVGYIVNGRAKKIDTLIAGSAIAGVGTGIQQTMPVIFGEMVSNQNRNTALGLTFALLAPLATIGPGLARVMVDNASWRWVYYFSAMMSGTAGLLQLFFYFPPNFHQLHTTLSKRTTVINLDFGGVIIFTGSVTSIILGISWGGQKYPWHSGEVISTMVVGGIGLIVFVLFERFAPLKEPLMPLYLFRNRNYVALSIVASVGSMIFYALNIVYPQQISAVYGKSVQTTGWMSCTLTAGAIFGQFVGSLSKWTQKWVSLKWQLVIVCVLFTTFTGGMSAVTKENQDRAIVFSLISSTMIGYMEVLTLAGAPLMVKPEDIGLANGVEYTLRSGCSVLADSVFVTILQNRVASNVKKWVVPAILEAGLPPKSVVGFLTALSGGNLPALEKISGVTPAVIEAATTAALRSYENAFQLIYLVSIAFGCCATVAALLLDSKKLAERMTPDVARKLQHVGHHSKETTISRSEP